MFKPPKRPLSFSQIDRLKLRGRELAKFDAKSTSECQKTKVGMLNLTRDKNEGTYQGGKKGRHLCPRLVHKLAEGRTSYELSWKAK